MEYVQLGKTGLKISRVGFGGIPLQRTDAATASALMDELENQGINFIDSARAYSISEELIGEALKGRRDRFVIATKSGAKTKEAMAADIETSLKNLQTDYIDLYQIHNPASVEQLEQICAPGGALEAVMEAKAAGKIGHIGLTGHLIGIFEKALELPWVETFMFPYNIVEQQAENLIAKCAEKGIGFICMKPLAGGAIDDARLAMRFICANPAVTVVIPGMFRTEEIQQNVESAADTSEFTEEELKKMDDIRDQLSGNFCRRCGYCKPCTAGIDIPNVFTFAAYYSRYGLVDWAGMRYRTLDAHVEDCVDCGLCEERCPYQLPIRQMLRESAKVFED